MGPPDGNAVATQPRALMPDYLRLVALFGIVVVNVQYIAFPALNGLLDPVGETFADALTLWLVHGLALLKTYGLFSFMFGVGLGFLMRSAARRGLSFGHVYRNRMIGLLVLGAAHGCLFFPGDILVIYSVTGSILYFVRDWPVRWLVRAGAVLLVVQPIIALPIFLSTADAPADVVAYERAVLGEGGFLGAVVYRTIGFAFTLPVFLVAQGVSALGWFCLGLAAVKSGMIDTPDHVNWSRARRWCLLPGLLLGTDWGRYLAMGRGVARCGADSGFGPDCNAWLSGCDRSHRAPAGAGHVSSPRGGRIEPEHLPRPVDPAFEHLCGLRAGPVERRRPCHRYNDCVGGHRVFGRRSVDVAHAVPARPVRVAFAADHLCERSPGIFQLRPGDACAERASGP
jgi:hypothetical protein